MRIPAIRSTAHTHAAATAGAWPLFMCGWSIGSARICHEWGLVVYIVNAICVPCLHWRLCFHAERWWLQSPAQQTLSLETAGKFVSRKMVVKMLDPTRRRISQARRTRTRMRSTSSSLSQMLQQTISCNWSSHKLFNLFLPMQPHLLLFILWVTTKVIPLLKKFWPKVPGNLYIG